MTHLNILAAVDRLFRAYDGYLEDKSKDTLFLLLNALHSLDDRLRPQYGRLFFDIPEYVALKALRNHQHHAGEVKFVLTGTAIADLAMPTDLVFACLMSAADRDAAINGSGTRYRDAVRDAFTSSTRDYGEVVDINPCIFNCVVRVYEVLCKHDLTSDSKEFAEMPQSYEFEQQEGYSHFVTGQIVCLPGRADLARQWLVACHRQAP
jgi:hypothetical protein